jgi:hypothetical protein
VTRQEHGRPRHIGKLIVLVRDYSEVLLRVNLEEDQSVPNDMASFVQHHAAPYLNVLKFYDRFPGRKTLHYYEDLIKNPLEEVSKLIEFLEMKNSDDRLSWLKENLHSERNQALERYGENRSDGRTTRIYSNRLDQDQIRVFHHTIRGLSGRLYTPYLERYALQAA